LTETLASVDSFSIAAAMRALAPGLEAQLRLRWLGDRWSRRHMMVIFFFGIGASMIAVGLVQNRFQLGIALLSIGLFASIHHPVGTAMIVSYVGKLGREMGLNGVWGNLGVASSALVTGVAGQYLGWRWAFIIPGVVTILTGVAFMRSVVHEDRSGFQQAAAQARVAKNDMWRVILSLLIVVVAISTTFNAVTVALPKLFAERLTDLTKSPALLGAIAAGVYVFGAMTQYTIGKLIDRHSLKAVSLPLSFVLAPFLYLAATLSNLPLILAAIGIVMGAFGQVPSTMPWSANTPARNGARGPIRSAISSASPPQEPRSAWWRGCMSKAVSSRCCMRSQACACW
jgi:MFS family permease